MPCAVLALEAWLRVLGLSLGCPCGERCCCVPGCAVVVPLLLLFLLGPRMPGWCSLTVALRALWFPVVLVA
eukprot:11954464-Prorocentrum_lima.AAC.1